jgi:hypothetical protein
MAMQQPNHVLGCEDEGWWSRKAQPQMPAWSDDTPVRLVEKTVPAKDPQSKATACDGLYVPTAHHMLWRFVQGRPVSGVTCVLLAWRASDLAGPIQQPSGGTTRRGAPQSSFAR